MAVGLVGMTTGDEFTDHRNHLFNMLRRARFDIGQLDAQCTHVVVVRIDEALCDLTDGFAGLDGCRIYLVIDVGDIPRKRQFVAAT